MPYFRDMCYFRKVGIHGVIIKCTFQVITEHMEWGIPLTRGGNGMSFPDRGPRAVMKFFQPEAGGRGLEHYSMPDSGQWNTIPINITEILWFKNLCHSNSEVKNLGMKIPTRVKTNGIC